MPAVGWYQGQALLHPPPAPTPPPQAAPDTNQGWTLESQTTPENPHQPAKEQEHPTAPFAPLFVQQTFLGGSGPGKDV